MTRKAAAALISVALFFSLAASAQAVVLVNPDGTPVGGQWQQWADEMEVPAISGTLPFVPNSSACVSPDLACSIGPSANTATTWDQAGTTDARSLLYFELGHQFDWRYLTDANRAALAHAWRQRSVPWLNSLASEEAGHEDGLEGVFAAAYSSCATGGFHGMRDPSGIPRSRINTCRYIARIARRVGADTESTVFARWNLSR